MVKKSRTIYILGAGMSGLATGLRLARRGIKTIVIEKEKTVGGLAGSFTWGEFKNLDYGPHIYHTPDKNLEEIWKKEYGDLFHQNEFWGKNVKGDRFDQFFDYPLSFDSLKKFPEEVRKKILYELAHLDETKRAKAKNYSEYVRELVGPTLMETFFIRYPQKLWGVPVGEMTANWAPKRINFRTKDEHFHAGQWSAVGKYGSGRILERMAEQFKKAGGKLVLQKTLTGVEHSDRLIQSLMFNDGEKIPISPADRVVSTIPFPIMAEHVGIKNNLKYRGAKLVFVALKKAVAIPDTFNFLYYDAPEIIFHRVSEQKKFCSAGFPKNKTVLTLEIAYTKGDALDKTDEKKIIDRAVLDLVTVGLAKKNEVYDTRMISLPHVYPLLTKECEEELVEVRSKLSAFKQLYGIGTGGDFHYADLQILNVKGFDLADRLATSEDAEEERELVKKDEWYEFNQEVMLGAKRVSASAPAFIIAEIGLNHNGSLPLAMELIDRAKEIGCSAVKFQTYRAANRISKEVKGNRYAEKLVDTEETTYEMLDRLEFGRKEHEQLFTYAEEKGIEIFSTPFDLESVELLESLGCKFYKISSMDLVNLPLIRRVAETGKPMIVSTGMSTLGQIEDAIQTIRNTGNKNVILLHCVSSYPASPHDMNLSVMNTLRTVFSVPVGLSDHAIGLTVATVAIAKGAQVIERHFTLDRFMEGPDHILSSDVEEMRELVRLSNLIPVIEGRGEKSIVGSEIEAVNKFKKCLYAKVAIKRGEKITADMLSIKGPGGGILPKHIDIIVGKHAKKSLKMDHPLTWDHI
ncbi:MAG TPA: FAD-dependent oxidoreductase [Candidatus Paceibacterota bacterium]